MGHRLSQIATRTGDDGTTGLADGTRLSKNHLRVHAMGEVDELNSWIGVLLTEVTDQNIQQLLIQIQHHLFDLGGELSMPANSLLIQTEHVLFLDQQLADYNASLPRLQEFILPGGSKAAAFAHIGRTVCRRAERHLLALTTDEQYSLNPACIQYLNRLSDLLFVLARVLNRLAHQPDVLWNHTKKGLS